MRNTVYARLFDRLFDLVPRLQSAPLGAVFVAPERTPGDVVFYCRLVQVEGEMRLVELFGKNTKHPSSAPLPWFRLRVDVANRLAEVLEMGDETGYRMPYANARLRRAQTNLYAVNWLQVMVNFELCFQHADVLACV